MAQRAPKQSQLDYLWVNFGDYSVSTSTVNGIIPSNTIPSAELVSNLLENIKNSSLNNLKVINNKLIGYNINNEKIFEIDITQLSQGGSSIVEFGKRYVTEEDTDIQFPVGTPIYYIELSDGRQLAVEASEGGVLYTGAETKSIVVNIQDGQISANLKLDNTDSVINLSETSKGLKADLKIDDNSPIKLIKHDGVLKAEMDTDSYYTKSQIDEKLATTGMDWNELI